MEDDRIRRRPSRSPLTAPRLPRLLRPPRPSRSPLTAPRLLRLPRPPRSPLTASRPLRSPRPPHLLASVAAALVLFAAGAAHGQGTPTFGIVAPDSPAQEGAAPQFSIIYTSSDQSPLPAAAVLTATVTNDVPPGHTNFSGLTGTGRACNSDWLGGTDDDSGCSDPGQTLAAVSCTVPANTPHGGGITCRLPMVADDTLAERAENYRVTLSGGPAGALFNPTSAQHTIATDELITISPVSATSVVEGSMAQGSTAVVRINFNATSGTTVPGEFRVAFEHNGEIVETPVISNWPAGGFNPAVGFTFDWAVHTTGDNVANQRDRTVEYTLRGSRTFNFGYAIAEPPPVVTITVIDNNALFWTARAWLMVDPAGTITTMHTVSDVNENAPPIASPATADPAAAARDDVMYFAFFNYARLMPRSTSDTVVTYCLGGTAVGGTAEQAAASPSEYDYIWPGNYDPDSETRGEVNFCTRGRGTFTIAAGAGDVYRLGVTLNDDNLNEGGDTITAAIVAVDEPGYSSLPDGSLAIGTAIRTIRDNDAIAAAIDPAGPDFRPGVGHQVEEGRIARFLITLDHVSAATATVPYEVDEDTSAVESADYGAFFAVEDGVTNVNPPGVKKAGHLVIPAGRTSATLAVPIELDDDTDVNEWMRIQLPVTPTAGTAWAAAGTIGPDTRPFTTTRTRNQADVYIAPLMSSRTLAVLRRVDAAGATTTGAVIETDDDAAAWFIAGFAGAADIPFTTDARVRWRVEGGGAAETAAADNDFAAVAGEFTMPAGATETRFAIPVAGDNRNEPTEVFDIFLEAADPVAGGGTLPSGAATYMIADDDRVIITLSGGRRFPEGERPDVIVNFGAELTRGLLTVRVDIVRAPRETLELYPVMNDYDLPQIEHGDGNTGLYGLPATPPNLSRAQIGGDIFMLPPVPGATSGAIPLYYFDEGSVDNLNEADETFWVVIPESRDRDSIYLSGAWGDIEVAAASQQYIIEDGDPITVSVAAAADTVAEGRSVRFNVTLEGAAKGSSADLDVLYTLSGPGGGVIPVDYGVGRLRFNGAKDSSRDGDTAGVITVGIPPVDALGAASEDGVITLEITGVEGIYSEPTLVANRELHVAQLVESDDYAIGEVTVSSTRNRASVAVDWVDGEHVFEATLAPPGRIAEGADANTMANWTITRTAGPDLGAGHLRLMWSVVPGAGANAAEAADFAATGGVLTFSGSTQSPAAQQLFNVQVVPDNLNEGDESFRVVFAAATATNIASLPPPQQIVIADNADDTIEVVIIRSTLTAVAITEDAPAPAIFRVDLSGGQRTSRVFMPFTISGDGITASDFDILSLTSSAGDAFDGELVFGGSAFEHTHVRLLDDDLNEAAETLTLTGAPPGADGLRTAGAIRYAATADADNAEVEILDNDPILVSLSASPDVTPETSLYNLWEGRVARFFITMDRASAAPATIAWAFLAGHGLRYRGPAEGTVTIPAGQTSATVGVRVLEGGTDDDLVFHLTNSPAPSAAGAISTDADNERLHVFFLPLMSTRTLTVLRRVDAAGATTTGAVVETDDDLALHYIAGFAGADDAPFAEDTRIRWLVGHGNRPAIVAVTDDDDFAAVSGEFTMPAGATETRFAITLTGDNRNESTETFNLSLSVDDAVLAAATTDDRTALGDVLVTAIRDDDPVVITLGGGRSFAEGTTPSLTVDFGAELTRPFLSHVNIYRHRDLAQGSALPDPGNHVVDRDGTELFTGSRWLPQGSYPWTWIARSQPTAMGFTAPAGTTAASITLDLFIDDGLNEADEMFWVTLNLDDNGELLIVSPQDTFEPFLADGAYGRAVFAVSSQAYTIVDNDPATLVVAADAAAVTEGRSVRFNVRLEGPSGGSDGDLDVLYTLDGLDGVAPVDLGGGRLRINRTQSAGAITVFIPPTGAFGASSDAQTLTLAINGVERRPTESLFQRDVHPDTGIVSISESVDRAAGEFNVSSTRSRASVTVNWADGEHVFELTSAPAVVSEAGGAAAAAAETWRVTRTAGRNLDGDGLQISWSAFPAGVGAGAADAADFTQSGAGDLTFRGAPGSATAQSFRVGINADGVSETTETFIVAFAVAAGNLAAVDAAGGLASLPAPHRVAIADNPADAVTVDIARDSATPASVAEGGEAAFRITLSGGARSADVMVPFMFSGDGITDSDFDIISPDSIVASTADGVLVFYTGNLRGRNEEEIRVRLPADNLNEAAETLTLSGAPPGAAGLRTAIGAIRYTTDTAVVSIADADRIQVSIAVAGADADPAAPGHQVQEGRTAEFTVTMDRTSVAAATIPYIIGGEVEPEDYGVSTMGAVVVPAGRTTAALTIPIRRDADTDTTETMTVALAESGYSAAGDIGPAAGSTATSVQITPLPAARTLRLVRADAAGVAVTTPTVAESDAGVAVYYRVGFEAGGLAFSTDTEVLWAVGHGNPSSPTVAATDDDDFAVVTGAVVMAAGTTDPAAFTLTIEGDNRNEPAEHFIVSVTVADPDADDITGLGDGVALAVEDDDRVVIRLSGGGSFTEGSIPAPLLHLDFGAELTRPFYADIALRRDDNPATRDIEIPDVRVGDDWQSAGSSGSLVVGARLGRPQTFQIPAGQSTGSVRLTALLPDTEGAGPDDGLNEADEVFQVVENRGENRGFSVPGLTAHGPVAVAGTTPTWTIVDDDDITVVVRASSDAVVEGRSVRFDIALEGAAGGSDANMDLFYTLTGLDDAPVTPSDSGGGRLRINRLQTTAAVIVGIPFTPQLGMMDDDRVLSLVVTGVQAAPTSAVPAVTADPAIGDVMVRAPHSEASVTVEWLDAAHVFTLSGAAAIAERAAFAIGETYMLTHSGPDFVAPLEIVWRIDAGGAGVADFTGATSGTLAFSGAGGGAQTFGIFVATDDLNETTETFSIVFDTDADAATSAGGVTLPAAHEVVITDSADDAIEVTVSRDTGTPASVAENSTAIFTVALSGGVRTADVVVPFMFSGAGITDADFDITTPSGAGAFGGELVFAAEGALAGDSTGVAVQLLDDDLNEAAKTLTLGGGAIAYAGGGAIAYADGGDAASVVITDNDPIEVSIAVAGVDYDAVTAGHQVPESRTAEFTVSMNRVSAATATIPYIIGGAVEPADYDGTTEGTVTIAAGSTAATLAIPILRDADTDTTETLTVTLAESGYSAAGVIGRTADAAGRGAEVEIVPLMVARTLQLTRVDGDGNEDTNPVAENTAVAGVGVRYRVGFTDAGATPFADDTAIAWRVVHGHPSSATVAATAAADFAAVSGSVVMAAAATQTAFTVTVAGDDLNEATEYFMVALAVDDIGTLPGSGTLAAITDDDAIEAAIAVAGADRDADAAGHQVREGGTAEFTVSMDRASAATATIPYTVGGDVEPEDYDGAAAGTVMIAAGRTTAALVIPILRDDDTDAAEIMTVALAESGYAAAGVIGRTAAGSTATSVQIVPAVALRTLQLTRVDGDDNEDTGAIAENTTSTAAAGVGVRYRVGFTDAGAPAFAADTAIAWRVVHSHPSSATAVVTTAADFAAVSGSVVMAAAATQTAFTITVAGDNRNEATEYFSVFAAAADLDTLPGTATAAAIVDDDQLRIALSGGRRFTEGETPQLHLDFGAVLGRDFEARVRAVRDASNPATDTIESADVTAAGGWTAPAQASVVVAQAQAGAAAFRFAAGASTGTIALNFVVDDNLNEADEVFRMEPVAAAGIVTGFTGAYGEISFVVASQSYTVEDNDDITVSVSAVTDTVSEGRSAEFAVVLTGAAEGPDGNLDVMYGLGGLSGVTLADSGGSLRFSRGSTNGVISAAIPFSDTLGTASPNQTLTVEITGISRLPTDPTTGDVGGGTVELADHAAGTVTATAPGNRASVTVEWRDTAHVFGLDNPPATIAEDSGAATTATYVVTRTGPALVDSLEVAWRLDLAGGGADAADFAGAVTGVLTFSGGVTSQTFRVYIAEDDLNEATETFGVVFEVGTAAAESAGGVSLPAAHRTAITDNADDAIEVTVSRDTGTPASVTEGGDATFTIALSGGVRTADVVVPFSLSGAGVTDADFDISAPSGAGAVGGEAVFGVAGALAGDSTNIVVQLLDDNLNEAAETLTLSGAAAGAAGLRTAAGAIRYAVPAVGVSTGTASVVIADNDPVVVRIAAVGNRVEEGDDARFVITMDRASAATATIPYAVGGDVEPEDYAGMAAGAVMIAAGQTTAALVIPILADADTDAVERMTVSLAETGYSAAGVIGRAAAAAEHSATVEITPLTAARTLRLTRVDGDGNEDTSSIAENTTSTAAAGVGVRYRVGFEDGGAAFTTDTAILWRVRHGHPSSATAVATTAADFAAVSGSVVMASAATQTAFTVTVIGDNRNEATEHFSMSIAVADAAADGGTLSGTGTTAAIVDDDRLRIALSGGRRFTEGETPQLHLDFGAVLGRDFEARVRAVRDASNPATDTIESADVTAAGGWTAPAQASVVVAQAQAGAAAFRFSAGASTGTIAINFVVDDNLNEADEVFRVEPVADAGIVTGFTGAYGEISFVVASQSYTVEDNDDITVSVSAVTDTVSEGRSVEFAVVLTGAQEGSDGNLDVMYSLGGLSGVTLADSGGSLRFSRGSTNGVITAAIPFSDMLGMASPTQTLTAEITGISRLPTDPTTGDVSGGTVELADHAAGMVTASAPGNRASVTVEWTDAAHAFRLDGAPTRVTEGAGGASTATYVLTRTGPALADSLDIAWRLDLAGGGADAADFAGAVTGVLAFSGGITSQTFRVFIAADDLNEADEDFNVVVAVADAAAAMAAGGAIVPAAHRTTIADSADDAIEVTVSRDTGTPASVTEGGNATFRIALSGGVRTADVVVPFSLSGVGITDADFDISAPSGAGAFGGEAVFGVAGALAGESTNIVVQLLDDDLNEAAETLTLTGAAAGAAGLRTAGGAIRYAAAAGTVMIADNDPVVVRIAADGPDFAPETAGHQVREGGDARFAITMDRASAAAATIPYAVGGDVEPEDYAGGAAGTVTIAAGRTTATLVIAVAEDSDIDTTETMIVSLAETGYSAAGVIGRAADAAEHSAAVVITDLTAARTLQLTRIDADGNADTGPVAEGDSGVAVRYRVGVTGEAGFSAPAAVRWTLTHGHPSSATAAATIAGDFTGQVAGSVTVPSGAAATADFTVTVAGDNLNEATEHFIVSVAAADAVGDGGTLPSTAVTAITDDDRLNITLSGGRRFAEGATPQLHLDFGAVLGRDFEARVRAVRDASNPATDTIESADVTAAAGWTAPSQASVVVAQAQAGAAAFRFSAGASTGVIALDFVVDDSLNEADEVFRVEPVADAGIVTGFTGAYGEISFVVASQSYTVEDNDDIAVSVSAVADTVLEGRSAEFAVVLTGAAEGSDGDLDVMYSLGGLSGVTLADSGGSLRLNRGSTNGVISAAIPFSDTLGTANPNQTLTLEITGVTGRATDPTTGDVGGGTVELADHAAGTVTAPAPGNRASATVEWADAAHIFRLDGAPARVAEGAGAVSTAAYVLTRAGLDLANRVEIGWRLDLAGGGADAADFAGAVTGVLAFSGAATSQTFGVGIAADDLNEADESFRVVVFVADAAAAESAGGVILPGAHRTTIADSADDAIEVTVSRDTGTPASVAEGGNATFRIALSGGVRTADVVVPFSLSGAGITDADFDISAPSGAGAAGGEVVFAAAGAMAGDSADIVVRLLDDNLNEAAETLTLTGAAAGAAGLRTAGGAIRYAAAANATTATVVITDNDAITASFAPGEITVEEGRTAEVTVLLDKASAAAVTVPYTVSAGGASPPSFTDATSGRISIAANSVRGVIRLEVLRNRLRTATGTLTVAFGALTTGAGGGAISGAGDAVVIVPPPFDTLPPMLRGLGWNGGQRTLWLTTNEPYKVLPYPDGARLSSDTASLTTLDAGGFSVIENNGQPSQATLTVASVRVMPQNRAFVLTLERALAADAGNVWVAYRRTGDNAIYDTALEDGNADPQTGRNVLPAQGPFMLPRTGDADGDGLPDAVEIAIGENPLERIAAERQPVFSLGRTVSPERVAYSGIREHGVLAHLGVSSAAEATQTAAQTITAYYRSATFGYDGTYNCAGGQFPANYAAPLADGGCAPVDWGDIRPGVNHTIAWLARSADGVWAVRTNTDSNLPEMVIRRIPELNMDAQSRYTTGTEVVVSASFDSTPNETLTLVLAQTPDAGGARTRTASGAGRTLSFTDTSPVSALWEIADVTAGGAPGGASRLYRPATATGAANPPAAGQYSLGLVRRTRVTRVNTPVPPVLGSAVVLLNGTPVLALVDGHADAYTLDVPVENRADIGAPGAGMATHNGTLAGISAVGFVAGGGVDRYRFTFTMRSGLLATTMTQAVIRTAIEGGFGGVTTATYRFPVVAANTPLAARRADDDRDGIADEFDAFDDSGRLPVAVDETAGANAWHHIRPVFPLHDLHLGEATVERLAAAAAADADEYGEYSASETPPDTGLAVVYDFEIGGVDYSRVTTQSRAGGVGGVIIPLPRSLYNGGVTLVKTPSGRAFSVAGGNDYGFAPLQNGACPDDTMAAGSPYRDGETLRRAKRGGDACLVVYIVDGGPNDEDGVANGVIKDPLGLREGAAGGGGGGGGGGVIGPGSVALAALLLALSLIRARRRRGGRPV